MEVLTVKFNGKLRHGEEQMFRGAFVREMGERATPLFHNHVCDGLRYSYPFVQYKVLGGLPAIVAIGAGAMALRELPLGEERLLLSIGNHKRLMDIAGMESVQYIPEVGMEPRTYAIDRYIPLNAANTKTYDSLMSLTDRVCLLENIINSNILSFFKGIGFHCDSDIQTAILSIDKKENLYYKGVCFHGFGLRFMTNAVLPENIGLGKSPSVGFGVLRHWKDMPQNAWLL